MVDLFRIYSLVTAHGLMFARHVAVEPSKGTISVRCPGSLFLSLEFHLCWVYLTFGIYIYIFCPRRILTRSRMEQFIFADTVAKFIG